MIFLIVAFNICFYFFIQFSMYNLHLSVLVGLSGLEPPTSRLSGVRSNRLSYKPMFPASGSHRLPIFSFGPFRSLGGDKRDRTVDLLLAKQALSQLSYTPITGGCYPSTF